MLRHGLVCLIAGELATMACSEAIAAPAQLLNKTVSLRWTNSYQQRAPDGQEMGRQIASGRTIYISSAGRLFERTTRSSDGGMKRRSDLGPGETQSAGGVSKSVRWAGDRLVGSVQFESGAAQYSVSFGAGFSSCSVDVVYGRSGGNMRMKGLDGRIYEILSSTVSGQSCSVSDGNALAN